MSFGKDCKSLFAIEEDYVNLNHGSFGAVPLSVSDKHRKNLAKCEGKPDIWFRETYRKKVNKARKLIAEHVNSDVDDIVLVESTSYGVNSVFRSFPFQKGDLVLIFSRAYPMVKSVLSYLKKIHGIEVIEVPVQFPIESEDDLIGPVEEILKQKGSSIKLASFSHIESAPGIILPIKKLANLCRSHGIKVFIDGAHAIGQVPIDIKDLDVDFYVSNLHKWFFSPKGTAFLYVRKEHQSYVVPAVLNQALSVGQTNLFLDNFEFTGTKDYTIFSTISAAFEFRKRLGDKEIMEYNRDLAWWAGNYCKELWGTILIAPRQMYGAMCDIELPVTNFEEGERLRKTIYEKYKTYFIIYELQGKVYTRISAQIHLQKEDFALFSQRVLQELKKSKSLS